MLTLASIGRDLQTDTVQIRGKSVTVTALSDAQTDRLHRLFPRPRAALGPNPNGGSKAPPEEKTWEPEYRRAAEDHYREYRAYEAVVACGFADDVGGLEWSLDDASFVVCIKRLASALRSALTAPEIDAIFAAARDMMHGKSEKILSALIVAEKDIPADAVKPEAPIHENYGETSLCRKLRVAERFGMDPRALFTMEPGEIAVLIEYERFRSKEEHDLRSVQ